MKAAGVRPNTITFNGMISACANASDASAAWEWVKRMKVAGVAPNSFTYNTAARPCATCGDYPRVEELMRLLCADGITRDDFCLATLLHAYGNARPKQAEKAAAVFREYAAAGIAPSRNSVSALAKAVGRQEAEVLCQQHRVAGEATAGLATNA